MFNLVSRSCVPLWLPCQFLCCWVSHFLLFVCAGGCQARWNAAEVILGRRVSAPTPGSTWPASPCSGLAWLHTEASPGEAAGKRSAHLAAAGGWCRGGVSYVSGCRGRRWRDRGRVPILPGVAGQRCMQPLAGDGDPVCLSSCMTSADPSAVPWLPSVAGFCWVMLGWRCGLWLHAGLCSRGRYGLCRAPEGESWNHTGKLNVVSKVSKARPYMTVSQGVCTTMGKRSSSLQESSWQKGEWCCGMVLFRMGLECLELPCSSVQHYWLEQRMGRFWCYFLFTGSVSSSDIRAVFRHSLQQEAHFLCVVLKVWIGNESLQCFSISILLSFALHSPGFLCIEQVLWDKGGLTRWRSCLVL